MLMVILVLIVLSLIVIATGIKIVPQSLSMDG
ncbi:MAG: hypothetical protein HNEKOMLI_00800 [Sodalis sp. Psp]|nr:hypothetical protein [Sodalis sp. Psp]MCR3757222.1 hypothetical protein [Sodalis sp. Ppy]